MNVTRGDFFAKRPRSSTWPSSSSLCLGRPIGKVAVGYHRLTKKDTDIGWESIRIHSQVPLTMSTFAIRISARSYMGSERNRAYRHLRVFWATPTRLEFRYYGYSIFLAIFLYLSCLQKLSELVRKNNTGLGMNYVHPRSAYDLVGLELSQQRAGSCPKWQDIQRYKRDIWVRHAFLSSNGRMVVAIFHVHL